MANTECTMCYGSGTVGWADAEGDYDFDICECEENTKAIPTS